jgi:hypothetical protein
MSNQVCLVSTKFSNVKTGNVSFGYRLYDGYGATYNNTREIDNWTENQEDQKFPDDDLDTLREAMELFEADNIAKAMFQFIEENEGGIEIDGTWYNWNEIKELF